MFGGKKKTKRGFFGHSVSGKKLGSGFSRKRGAVNGPYDPNKALSESISGPYQKALASGSGAGKPKAQKGKPSNLFGRSSFESPDSPLARGSGASGGKRSGSGSSKGSSWSKNPRQFIKF